jgi:hypothetical protein
VLEQQHVSPDAVELPETFASADSAKAAGVVEGDAGGVLGKDASLHGPDPGPLGGVDEGGEQDSSDAVTLVGG